MPKHRLERVTQRIKQELSQIISYELKDPRVGFVTITRVKVAPDYTTATVFLSVLGSEGDQSATLHALSHARGHIQTELARRIEIRRHPEIAFKIDEGYLRSVRVSRILSEIGNERASEAEEASAPPDDAEEDPPET